MKHGLSVEERITYYTKMGEGAACWGWVGAKDQFGYAQIRNGACTSRVSRLLAKPLPSQVVMHTCNNAGCVNPEHLRCGDHSTNNIDAVRDGLRTGQTAPKLTFAEAEEIRAAKVSRRSLASKFGVSLSVIHDVLSYRTYLQDHSRRISHA